MYTLYRKSQLIGQESVLALLANSLLKTIEEGLGSPLCLDHPSSSSTAGVLDPLLGLLLVLH